MVWLMSPEQFKAWRKRRGFSRKEAGAALGVCTTTIQLYERGTRFDRNDQPVVIPKTVRLAMAALAKGIKDYDGDYKAGYL